MRSGLLISISCTAKILAMARAILVGSLFTAAVYAARIVEIQSDADADKSRVPPLLGTHCQHSIPGASIHLSAAEPLYGTATELDHMEVLTAANVMNATGGNSEGIEGMLERSPKAVQA